MITIQNSAEVEQERSGGELAVLLRCHTRRAGLTYEQLAEATGLALDTLLNWVKGRVRHPRNWRDVARIAQVLHLTRSEADALLRAAGYSALAELQRAHPDNVLLATWPCPPAQADSRQYHDIEAPPTEATPAPIPPLATTLPANHPPSPALEHEDLATRPQAADAERLVSGTGFVRLLRRWWSERR